ncbi:MAG TPA: hypothetical protein VFE98_03635 [Candidatus Bathyarchaeia archaeon]|nr:hypothetical protein [Candidatus Bathyarchaeia archaeon]
MKPRGKQDSGAGRDHASSIIVILVNYLWAPLLAALTLFLVDCTILFVTFRVLSLRILTLIVFLEAGLGLLAGVGIALSSGPSVSRVGQTLFGTAAWSRQSERHAERVGSKWMVGAAFLVMIGFTVSSLA